MNTDGRLKGTMLTNPRREAFARELAKGKTQVEAYASAGYKSNDGHAARLAGNGRIKARVAELQGKAAERAVVTIETIAAQLDEDRRLAHERGQAGAAVSASMAKAKLYGLVVEKRDVDIAHHIGELSDEELEAEIAALLAEQMPVVAH
jgi:phage terminase small subunit